MQSVRKEGYGTWEQIQEQRCRLKSRPSTPSPLAQLGSSILTALISLAHIDAATATVFPSESERKPQVCLSVYFDSQLLAPSPPFTIFFICRPENLQEFQWRPFTPVQNSLLLSGIRVKAAYFMMDCTASFLSSDACSQCWQPPSYRQLQPYENTWTQLPRASTAGTLWTFPWRPTYSFTSFSSSWTRTCFAWRFCHHWRPH